MKTPTWGYVVGVIMILFGGCSTLKSINAINSPKDLEVKQEIVKDIFSKSNHSTSDSTVQDSIQIAELDSTSSIIISKSGDMDNEELAKKINSKIEKAFQIPDNTKIWMVRFAYLGIFFSLVYLLGGIFLIVKKAFSIKLAYVALILSILFSIAQFMVYSNDSPDSLITLSTGFSKFFGVLLDIILLIVVLVSDKDAYRFDEIENRSV